MSVDNNTQPTPYFSACRDIQRASGTLFLAVTAVVIILLAFNASSWAAFQNYVTSSPVLLSALGVLELATLATFIISSVLRYRCRKALNKPEEGQQPAPVIIEVPKENEENPSAPPPSPNVPRSQGGDTPLNLPARQSKIPTLNTIEEFEEVAPLPPTTPQMTKEKFINEIVPQFVPVVKKMLVALITADCELTNNRKRIRERLKPLDKALDVKRWQEELQKVDFDPDEMKKEFFAKFLGHMTMLPLVRPLFVGTALSDEAIKTLVPAMVDLLKPKNGDSEEVIVSKRKRIAKLEANQNGLPRTTRFLLGRAHGSPSLACSKFESVIRNAELDKTPLGKLLATSLLESLDVLVYPLCHGVLPGNSPFHKPFLGVLLGWLDETVIPQATDLANAEPAWETLIKTITTIAGDFEKRCQAIIPKKS